MGKKVLDRNVLELRRAGWSMPRIARHYGVSTVAVYNYISRRLPNLAKKGEKVRTVGVCAICGQEGPLDSDHCHAEGHNRGMLCRACNQGLGMFKDSRDLLQRAIVYLTEWSQLATANT